MPPIISIVGESQSGKTTLIERLLKELKSRGYRVATIKHAAEYTTFDEPGKDSWRHAEAGSDAIVISSPREIVLIKRVTDTPDFESITRLLGEDYDIILAEGFKNDGAPKIEVHRSGIGPPLGTTKKLVAIATDEPLESNSRQFDLEDIKSMVDLLEKGFIEPQKERISLYVNDTPITLTSFPKEITSNILIAMASNLKGVGEIRNLAIFLRKKPKND